MTDTDISNFRAGYNEARSIAMGRIKEIVSLPNGHLAALKCLIKKLEKEEWEDHWRTIQEESPGITVEEYEADLDRTAELIREEYYQKNGLIKLRLLESPRGNDVT
jgi:hypothetical protein